MTRKTIVRVVSKALIPFILLFALYTQFHGDYGPGGGFQAGVILAAGLVVYGLVVGLDALNAVFPPAVREVCAAMGVLIYAGVGFTTMALGGRFLEYGVLTPHHPEHGQHYGILLVELGVGLTVSSVMVILFAAFAARARVAQTEVV